MKPRHAAALALMGWYLMAPPLKEVNPNVVFDWNAPISKWIPVDSFDSAADCQKEIEAMNKRGDAWAKRHNTEPRRSHASCADENDPRLMRNPFIRYFKLGHLASN
jgi:hypothetical protein